MSKKPAKKKAAPKAKKPVTKKVVKKTRSVAEIRKAMKEPLPVAPPAAPIMDDLEAELGVTAPSTTQLQDISTPVNKALELMAELEQIEELAKAKRAELHQLTTIAIPDAMSAAGTSEFKTTNGAKVMIKDFINGSLPKEPDARKKALDWLRKNDAADLIKHFVNLEFGKGDNRINQVIEALDAIDVEYVNKEDVHAQTLAANARERMKRGEEVPLDLLGLYAGRAAKITLPKDK